MRRKEIVSCQGAHFRMQDEEILFPPWKKTYFAFKRREHASASLLAEPGLFQPHGFIRLFVAFGRTWLERGKKAWILSLVDAGSDPAPTGQGISFLWALDFLL